MDIAEKTLQLKQDIDDVYEAGKKSQYDTFWDNYQKNGQRTNYTFAFAGAGWNKDNLKPKYKVVALDSSQGGSQMFDRCNLGGSEYIDFSLIADMFDFSKIEYAYSIFNSAKMENIIADLSSATQMSNCFGAAWASQVAKNITIKVSENVAMTNTFNSLIENLTFMEGSVIGKSITVNSKKLTADSIVSIIEHLSDTSSGQAVTLNTNAVNNMTFPHISKQSRVTYNSWNELIATKTNWTISTLSA